MPRPHQGAAGGHASAFPTRSSDTYQKKGPKDTRGWARGPLFAGKRGWPARARTLKVPRSRTRACSSRGSSLCPSERSTCAPQSPVGALFDRARRDVVLASPSGTARDTGRSGQSAEAATRTRPRRPPACSDGRRRHRSPRVATRPPDAVLRACVLGDGSLRWFSSPSSDDVAPAAARSWRRPDALWSSGANGGSRRSESCRGTSARRRASAPAGPRAASPRTLSLRCDPSPPGAPISLPQWPVSRERTRTGQRVGLSEQ
jgi:hypothetical protein